MRIQVVGGGIIGLTCALRLRDAGHTVGLVTADPPEHTTSAVAAAIWYPYRAFPRERVSGWAARTFQVLEQMSRDPATGVDLRQGREYLRVRAGEPWWRDAVQDLRRVEDVPDGYADGYELTLPVVDMRVHLDWLTDQLIGQNVTITQDRLTQLPDAGLDLVVNCSGLGARNLAGDQTMVPVRGQVVVIAQQGLEHWTLDQSDPQQLTYVIPRRDTIVLGGTADDGREDLDINPETAREIVERCQRLVPELAGAKVLHHRVGLRPARPTVRLDREIRSSGSPVVHCYGHGGAGVTLAYGCADEVTELAGQ